VNEFQILAILAARHIAFLEDENAGLKQQIEESKPKRPVEVEKPQSDTQDAG